MTNQQLKNSITLAISLTCLTFTLQACAGGYGSNSPASSVTDKAASQNADAAQAVFKVVTGASPVYAINGNNNPAITLKRGVTYTFELKATGHPFWIKTLNSTGVLNAYTNGVTGNGLERGTLTFAVPTDAPALLHYNCQVHDTMNGAINIID